jgi:serine/threonine-protein kinase
MNSQRNNTSNMALPVGTRLYDGKFVVERTLGAGGFGITYKVRHTVLNQPYAVKEFFLSNYNVRASQSNTVRLLDNLSPASYDKYRQRFIEEAQIIATYNHPNIIKVTDVFTENNTAYYVMEYIEGQSLGNIVKNRGKLGVTEAAEYVAQIANAADVVHKHGKLHRDIKPDNIMINRENLAILIDFGAARSFVQGQESRHTQIYSLAYAPPEQLSLVAKRGAFSDVYALGATFYHLITGSEPSPADARRAASYKMPSPKDLNPAVPEHVNGVIMRALAMDPEDRPQNMTEFLNDLSNSPKLPSKTNASQAPKYETITVKIGRATDNDVVIPASDTMVSRYHCTVTRRSDGGYEVVDVGSTNGVYVNGTKITGRVRLSEKDTVRIGNTVLPWTGYFSDTAKPETELQKQEPVDDTETVKITPPSKPSGNKTAKNRVITIIILLTVLIALLRILHVW